LAKIEPSAPLKAMFKGQTLKAS